MIETTHISTPSSTAVALISLSAFVAASPTYDQWPKNEKPAYVTTQAPSTFSPFQQDMVISEHDAAERFSEEISSVFAKISAGQEPLGADFEAVWDKNAAELYGA